MKKILLATAAIVALQAAVPAYAQIVSGSGSGGGGGGGDVNITEVNGNAITGDEVPVHDADVLSAINAPVPDCGASPCTNDIGNVGIDQSKNQVQAIPATTGGLTKYNLTAANSTNATNVKASAGTLYHISAFNNSATLAWVSFYNTAGTPTCGTGIVYQTMIPANSTSGSGAVEDIAMGLDFGTGIGICVTTGIAGTGSVAASAYVVNLGYK